MYYESEKHRRDILNLKHNESYYIDLMDEGGAEIWKINNVYLLFEISLYGGPPSFCKAFYDVDEILKKINSWT